MGELRQLKVMVDAGLLRRFRVAALGRDMSAPEVVRQLVERWVVVQESNGVLAAGDPTETGLGANDGSPPGAKDSGLPIVAAVEPPSPAASVPDDGLSLEEVAFVEAVAAGADSVMREVQPAPSAPHAVMPCPRKARHHINHGGKPCPTCGWPHITEGWEQS